MRSRAIRVWRRSRSSECPTRGSASAFCACVLARANDDAASITIAGFAAFLQEMRVAKFKWPEHVEVFEEFPMTKIGKIDKTALRGLARERIDATRRST